MLTRDELLKPRTKKVFIEALGGEVCLRQLSAGDIVGMDADDVGMMLARSLASSTDGERMFTDEEKDMALALRMDAVNEIAEAISEFNGFDESAQQKN